MTKEMQKRNEHEQWFGSIAVQMADISESFVGIGKIVIDAGSLYRYIADTYGIESKSLPFVLVRKITESIAYNLRVAGFKESYIIIFENSQRDNAETLCMRECVSVLAKETLIPMCFSSVEDDAFYNFIHEEHICMAVGYHDEESLCFLNAMLGQALYAGVLYSRTFVPPRMYMFVMDPSQFNYQLYAAREREATNKVSPQKDQEDQKDSKALEEILEKHFSNEQIETMKKVLKENTALRYYGNKDVPLPENILKEISLAIKSKKNEVLLWHSLSDRIDGVILQGIKETSLPRQSKNEEEKDNVDKTDVDQFIPTKMVSVTFYNEDKERTHRSEQMYIESLKKTAQSLHEGKHLHNPISVVTEKSGKKKREAKETKEKISKKQQQIIDENNRKKEEEAKKKDVVFLKSFLAKYQGYATVKDKKNHLDSFLPRIHSSFICLKVLLLRIEFHLELWSLEKRKKKPNEKDLVSIYMDALTFIEKYNRICEPEELEYVVQTLFDLNFASTALELCNKYQISYKNKKDGKEVLFENRKPLSLLFNPSATAKPNDFDISFLMRVAGDKLKRSLDSKPDKRLLFEPDAWQARLLTIVDEEQSAVICAPTSTGKTFICYYAMEKILRDSNENIVVFVAPTKALVNQVAADVYARFGSKPYIKQNNILQGICMSDFQISPFNCQVLITVPEVLEKILVMPPETKKKETPYLSRIKYIVIDEVHKISDSRLGSSLEKIIHFSPCAILLLSATLGNLEEFHRWVEAIEKKKGNRKCHLVVHSERYCEIKNYVFVPQPLKKIDNCHKTTREEGVQALVPIHSLFAYSFRNIKEDGFSDDVNFLPEELLNLYYAIFAVLRKDQMSLIKQFRPQSFFDTNCITKKHIKAYETHVIGRFTHMIESGLLDTDQVKKIYSILIKDAQEGFKKIESSLQQNLGTYIKNLKEKHIPEDTTTSTTDTATDTATEDKTKQDNITNLRISPDILLYNIDYLLENILDLVIELEAKNMLPCIVFNLERTVCNALATRLVEDLEKYEKMTEPTVSKTDIRENEKVLKEMKRTRDALLSAGKDAWIGESILEEEKSTRNVDINARSPKFCFTDPSMVSSGAYVLDEYAKSLKKTGKMSSKLIHALYRGIGVHHTGTPKKYRNMVEILFRMKQLRVIFATETLALGINMPCKTAVFAGDSLSLDAMSFKQMSGRAGRRGYDTQGNVVFFGISKQKIQSLITSYLPKIKGSYPYTNSLCVQSERETCPESVTSSYINTPLMSLSLPSETFLGATETAAEFRSRLLQEQKKNLVDEKFLSDKTLVEGRKKSLSNISSLTDVPINNLLYDPEAYLLMALVRNGAFDKICGEGTKESAIHTIIHIIANLFEVYPLPIKSQKNVLSPLPDNIEKQLQKYHRKSIDLSISFMSSDEKELYYVLQEKYPLTVAASSFTPLPYAGINKSAYIMMYFEHAKVKEVLDATGMGETELWQRLKRVQTLLESLSAYYKTYHSNSNTTKIVEYAKEMFKGKFEKMHA